jgi:Domain of unknown function (DUF222)
VPVVEESVGLAGMLPGPELAGVLAGTPVGPLDDFGLVEVMRAARRLTAWAESVELASIAELDRRRGVQVGRYGSWTVEMDRALCDEISAALTLSGTAAAIRLGIAGKLAELLPSTRRALAEGRIDAAKARVICDGVLGVGDEIARRVEQLVLPDAPRLTTGQLAARSVKRSSRPTRRPTRSGVRPLRRAVVWNSTATLMTPVIWPPGTCPPRTPTRPTTM